MWDGSTGSEKKSGLGTEATTSRADVAPQERENNAKMGVFLDKSFVNDGMSTQTHTTQALLNCWARYNKLS